MSSRRLRRPAFAVLRFDSYSQGPVTDLGQFVTVKEVLFTLEEATEEARRLNALVQGQGKAHIRYEVQYTRLVGDATAPDHEG